MIIWLAAIGLAGLTQTSTGAEGLVLDFDETPSESADVGTELSFEDEETSTLDFSDDAVEPAEAPWLPLARANAALEFKTALDTSFDDPLEIVGETQLSLRADLTVDLAEDWTASASPRFLFVYGLTAAGESRSQWYVPIPEAQLKFRRGRFTVRAGTLTFAWGSSDLIAPIDVLNPRDLRVNTFGIGDELKLPIPAVEVRAVFGSLVLRAVVQPIFMSSRFHLVGWDTAALPANGSPLSAALADPSATPATWIDQIGDLAATPQRPKDPAFTTALRATFSHNDVQASLSFIHGYESTPRIFADPDLQDVVARLAVANAAGTGIPTDDPSFLLALARLDMATREGQEIFFGRYERRTVLGFDGSWVVDPVAFKLDIAWSPKRTFYQRDLMSVRQSTLTAVVGAEYAYGEEWSAQVELFDLIAFGLPAGPALAYFEDVDATEADRTLHFPGLAAGLSYRPNAGDVSFELGGFVSFLRHDRGLAPRVSWTFAEHHQVSGGALWVDGKADGIGGTYDGIDQVFASYRLSM